MLATSAALVLIAGAFAFFVRLERQGRAAVIFTVLIAYLVLECVLYPSQNEIPVGIFHPGAGELTFRLAEALVAVAFAARLLVRGAPKVIGVRTLWWVGFFTWIATAAVVGMLAGNDVALVAFEAKAIVYLGAMAIAAGVPGRHLVHDSGLLPLISGCTGLAVVLMVTHQAGLQIQAGLPLVPIERLGELSPDLATVFSSLGALALVLAALRKDRRLRLLICGAVLLMPPALVSGQRAAMLAAVLTLVVVIGGLVKARERLSVTPTEAFLCAAAVASFVLVPSFVTMAGGGSSARLPFSDSVETAFTNRAKEQSAQSRINQLVLARDLIGERPIGGWGLGTTYVYFLPGHDELLETNLTHNILLDLMVRTGVIGALLFLAALAGTLSGGWNAWRRQPDLVVAALGLAAIAAVGGILGKGLVESIFEKYRLATLLGLMLGAARSAATSSGVPTEVLPSTPSTWSRPEGQATV